MADLKKEVESLLFSSGRVMTEKDLADVIGVKLKDVQKALLTLKEDYDKRDTSLTLMQNGAEWKLNVKAQYVSLVTKIVADTELPFPLLETLSVIAYKAPAWQAEVIQTRGTNAYEHIQALIDAGFVDRRKKGRSFELVLTQKFFEYFDVPGEQKLKMMFKDVKPNEPKKKKMGKLDVVDVPENPAMFPVDPADSTGAVVKGKLGDLDVVEVPLQPGKKPEPFKPDNDFLDSMDNRIGELSKKNDELDKDELFKKEELPSDLSDGDSTQPIVTDEKDEDIFGDDKKKEKSKDGSIEDNDDEEYKTKDPLEEDDDKVEI